MAPYLRPTAIVIDEETERAVAQWVRLGDQVTGKTGGERVSCSRCGSRDRVLDRGSQDALCARCYLERGAPPFDYSKARPIAVTRASPLSPSPR